MTELTRLVADYRLRTDRAYRTACKLLSDKVRNRTPVDTSALASSWTPSINAKRTNNVDGGNANSIAPVIAALKLGDTYYYVNGQPYARYIEYLSPPPRRPGITRYDSEAPYGMLRRSVAEWQQIVDAAVRRHGG